MTMELWKQVQDWDEYVVSNLGRIGRVILTGCRPLSPAVNLDGYFFVHLSDKGRRKCVRVHKMVCAAFNGPQPTAQHEVAHNDGDKANNRADNLRWATRKENAQDVVLHGHSAQGERHYACKLTEQAVRHIRSLPAQRGVCVSLARQYGVSNSLITMVRNGKIWGHVQ